MNINDWKTIQMRNDIKYIKRNTTGNNAASWSLVIDLFLVLLAFVMDQIHGEAEPCNIWWIIIAACGFAIPLILIIHEKISSKRAELISRKVKNTRELVATFDDEICYMIMSAESFSKKLTDVGSIAARQEALLLEFYIIEADYYLSKAVRYLLKMDTNLISVLDETDMTKNHISKARLINAISLIASLYEGMFSFALKQSDALAVYSVDLDMDAMRKHYDLLKNFATERQKTIGIRIDYAFKAS